VDEAGLKKIKEVEAGALKEKEEAKVPERKVGVKVGEKGAAVEVQ